MASKVKLADVVVSRFAHLTPSDPANVERIRADLVDGSKMLLNNPHVFRNEAGAWEILAGHDRIEAARLAGWDEVQVRDFSGTLNTDDAILAHFCRENLLRKDISKATIAGEWLRRHPEWSDAKIAEQSGCTAPHVGTTRAELGIIDPKVLSTEREGRDGRTTRPRTVRRDVPSRRGIPHPTKTEYESPEDTAAALFRKSAPEPKGSTDNGGSGDEGLAPQSVDAAGVGDSDAAEPMADRTAPEGIAPSLNRQGGEPAVSSDVPELGTPAVVDGDGPAEGDDEVAATWEAVIDLASLTERTTALTAKPAILRRAALHLNGHDMAGLKAFHRALGTFLLQAEIARKEVVAA